MNTSSQHVRTLIREIKRRWVVRAMKQGLAVCVLSFLILTAGYLVVLWRFDPSPFWQTMFVSGSLLIVAVLAGLYIVRPFLTRIDDRTIALFIEEKFPGLEDRLNSAVELDAHTAALEQNALLDMLVADAASKAGTVQITTVVDRSRERILTWTAYALLALAVLFVYSFRSDLAGLTSRMAFLVGSQTGYRPEISITPGDVEVEAGESQEVIVTLRHESSQDVLLHYRTRSGEWHRETMARSLDHREHLYRFQSIQEPITYYVEYRESVSPEYDITVYEYPRVMQIDLAYDYPDYTGMPDRREDNTGNIRALTGTGVTLTVTASGQAVSGELIIDSGRTIPLVPQGGGIFSGSLVVEDYGTYLVRLTDDAGKHNKFPDEYLITPVEDELPLITITDPKRDLRVNPLEEVVIAANAGDDYGIASLRLVYSVNGGDEERVDLAGEIDGIVHDAAGSHVLYLEDYALTPGDIVSYYIESEDTYHVGDPSMTDMYFIEITPFDATYTQVANQGGMQQQGQQQQQGSQMVTSEQMVIAATWKLHRLRNEKSREEFDESLEALIQAQANLMYEINDRVNSTAMSEELVTSDENRSIVDLLRNAVKEMGAAIEDLVEAELMDALKPEQRALNNLLRADALNKERQVQLSQSGQQSQSGAQGQSSEERMTELMDLELDISRDKYEIQQQNQSQQAEAMDDAMERLRELADRQQELARENRENLADMNGEEARRFLDRLERDQEELRQQAEEMSSRLREMARNSDQMSREMQERMEQVAETMRQAEQDLKNGNVQESLTRQQQALNELNRLQQDMQFSMSDSARERLGEFAENYNDLRDREERLAEEIEQAAGEVEDGSGRTEDERRMRELAAEREHIREQLDTLEEQAVAIESQTMQENPEIAANMRNIRNAIRRENIEELMEESERFLRNGWLSYSDALEEMIMERLDALDEQVAGLDSELPVSDEEQLARSLAETRDMRERIEQLMEEVRGGQRQDGQNPDAQAQSGGGRQPDSGDAESPEQQNRQAQASQQSGGEQTENNGQAQNLPPSGGSQAQNRQQEGQQSQGSGQPGENDRRQATNGGMSDRDAAVRLEQLMNQFDSMLDQMEQRFDGNPDLQETIEAARRSAIAAYTGELLGEDAEERFREEVFDPLSQLELALQERLDEIDLERKLYSMRSADVPSEYRSMVNRYFESLAKEDE